MTPARILIVEDERITAAHLNEVLSDLGYTVTGIASSGASAIEHAEQTSPDLVLMDVRIEGNLDGLATAKIIRERFGIPSIYLTAHADEETILRAKQAEPLGYIVKPFQERGLQATIEVALHKSKEDRKSREYGARIEAALDSLGQAVVTADAAGRVTFMNAAAETWTGWDKKMGAGKAVEDVVPLAGYPGASHPLRRAAKEGVLDEIKNVRLISRDSAEHEISGNVGPTWDQGRISGAVLLFGSPESEGEAWNRSAESAAKPAPLEIVFESDLMRQTISFARRVAASEVSTVLLQGESGTGKDMFAKYLHYNSRRQNGPFVAINCAAIPETLLESELFGYEKGAFTDARNQKKGILETGNGGTVFLDEIGEMSLLLQAKLLRVLEDQKFRRLGGVKDLQADLRVIAATNRPLWDQVSQGRFRMDLYYRLNVIQILVPPLRDRKDDILPLANHFIRSLNQKFGRKIRGVSPEVVRMLLAHEWPGNVRELRNTIERAMVLEDSEWLQASSCSFDPGTAKGASASAGSSDPRFDGLSLEEAEKAMLMRALEKTGGNQTQAARILNITRDTLRYKIKKFNLTHGGSS